MCFIQLIGWIVHFKCVIQPISWLNELGHGSSIRHDWKIPHAWRKWAASAERFWQTQFSFGLHLWWHFACLLSDFLLSWWGKCINSFALSDPVWTNCAVEWENWIEKWMEKGFGCALAHMEQIGQLVRMWTVDHCHVSACWTWQKKPPLMNSSCMQWASRWSWCRSMVLGGMPKEQLVGWITHWKCTIQLIRMNETHDSTG